MEKVGKLFRRVAAIGAAAATAITVGWAKLADSTADRLDKIAKTASRIGNVSAEGLQRLQFAGERAGVPVNQLNLGLQRVVRRMAEIAVQGGGTAAKALGRLGIRITDNNGKLVDAEELMLRLADAMGKKGADGAKQLLDAFQLFDSEGAGLVNLLKGGRKELQSLLDRADALGIVLSNQAAKGAEKYQDAMLEATLITRSLKDTLALALMPRLTRMLKLFARWWIMNRQLIMQRLDEVIQGVYKSLSTLWRTLLFGLGILNDVVDRMGGWEVVLRTLSIALVTFFSAKIITGILKFGAAFFTAARSVGLLKAAMMLLGRIPIVALLTSIGLVVEDLIVYLNGGKSAFGDFYSSVAKKWDTLISRFKLGWERAKKIFQAFKDAVTFGEHVKEPGNTNIQFGSNEQSQIPSRFLPIEAARRYQQNSGAALAIGARHVLPGAVNNDNKKNIHNEQKFDVQVNVQGAGQKAGEEIADGFVRRARQLNQESGVGYSY